MSEDHQLADGQINGGVPRRQALCGIAGLGLLGSAALAGCSSDEPVGKQAAAPPAADAGAKGSGVPGAVATLSDIPAGTGRVVTTPKGELVIVVHEADGTVKAFSGKCTHRGYPLLAPKDGVMVCPAHNSKFSAKDGSVEAKPATSPLAPVNVKVQGQAIVLA